MSKYSVDASKVRKDEIEDHPTSSLNDKHYSYSRVSVVESQTGKQGGDLSKTDEISGTIDHPNESKNTHIEARQEVNQVESDKGKDNNKGLDQYDDGVTERQREQIMIKSGQELHENKKASESAAQVIREGSQLVSKNASMKFSQLMNAISSKAQKKKNSQLASQLNISQMKEEYVNGDDGFTSQKPMKSITRLSQQLDMENISAIQEKKNQQLGYDESAQEEELQSLLNNNNNGVQLQKENQMLANLDIHQEKAQGDKINEVQRRDPKPSEKTEFEKNKIEKEKSELADNILSEQEEWNGGKAEALALNRYNTNEQEKRRRIAEAQKKKELLEKELLSLQSEIAEIHKGENIVKEEKRKQELRDDMAEKQQAINLVRKMNGLRKEKLLKEQRDREMFAKSIFDDVKETHERHVKLSELLKQEKRDKIAQKIQQIHVRSEERRILNKQANHILKEIKEDEKTHDPNERYRQQYELPELERRKKELADKRKLFKPIELDEIREHAKKHDQEIKIRKLQSKTNVLVDYNNLDSIEAYKYPVSQSMNRIIHDDKLFKMRDITILEQKKSQFKRRREYAKLVKEVHLPLSSKYQQQFENQEHDQDNYLEQDDLQSIQDQNYKDYVNQHPNTDFQRKYSSHQVHGKYSPHQVQGKYSPQQVDGKYSPHQVQGKYSPQQVDGKYSSQQVDGNYSPQQVDGNYSPQQVDGNYSHQEVDENYSPQQGAHGKFSPQKFQSSSKKNIQNSHYTGTKISQKKSQASYYVNESPQQKIPNSHINQVHQNKNVKSVSSMDSLKAKQRQDAISLSSLRSTPLYQNMTEMDQGRNVNNTKSSYLNPSNKQDYSQNKRYKNDYLQEMRNQRQQQGKVAKLEDWEKYKYDPSLSQSQKYAYILQSAQRLDHGAKLKEKNHPLDSDQQEQANNLYIDSIKAKLSLLDNIT